MAVVLLIQGHVSNPERWKAYSQAVTPLIARFGGRHLTDAEAPELLEGRGPDGIVALFSFPTAAAVHVFWNSADYVPVKALREGAAELEIRVVPLSETVAIWDRVGVGITRERRELEGGR